MPRRRAARRPWFDWTDDIERVELIGPFAAGGKIVMTPIGDGPDRALNRGGGGTELFIDEADMWRSLPIRDRVFKVDG